MIKKRCLFCDKIVVIQPEGNYDRFIDCACSPGGFYNLHRDSYEPIQSLPHPKKRDTLHIISAYIREQTDRGEQVTIAADDLDAIVNDPQIPATMEAKGGRLLQYLYRHADREGDPVVIQPLSASYNLTYSHNLQELVYILDKLSSDNLLIREGMSFRLTAKGWKEAAAQAGGKKLKNCSVLLSKGPELRAQWQETLFPKIEQLGYLPHMLPQSNSQNTLEVVAMSQAVIADLTDHSPEVYLAAGYALALNLPVIWTINGGETGTGQYSSSFKEVRPIVWNTFDELTVMIQQRLNK
ncbi:hypothetical protein [Paenibacillus yonginensis]|uniref:hypothetical protein n=1 Tax=Paenibacillus yonginensis TaxID=1462996 RepID=UPI000837ABC1|nr:hypothetical protein [Paenibacillus yonginensis]